MSLGQDVRLTMEHLTDRSSPKSIGTLGTRPIYLVRDKRRHQLFIVGYSRGGGCPFARKKDEHYLTVSLQPGGPDCVVNIDMMRDPVHSVFLLEQEERLLYLRVLDSIEPGVLVDTEHRAHVTV